MPMGGVVFVGVNRGMPPVRGGAIGLAICRGVVGWGDNLSVSTTLPRRIIIPLNPGWSFRLQESLLERSPGEGS